MNIVIVDKYPMLRLGLINFLGGYFQHLTVVELDNFRALESGTIEDVDLIVLGIGQAASSDSVTLIASLKKRYPYTKLIAYDEKPQPVLVTHYFRAGLQGYVSKQEDPKRLIECINQVMSHQKYISEQIVDQTLDLYLVSTHRSKMSLSARESQVASFLCEGMSTSAIAEALDRKPSTISTIKLNIFQKMRVDNVIKLREQFAIENLKWRR